MGRIATPTGANSPPEAPPVPRRMVLSPLRSGRRHSVYIGHRRLNRRPAGPRLFDDPAFANAEPVAVYAHGLSGLSRRTCSDRVRSARRAASSEADGTQGGRVSGESAVRGAIRSLIHVNTVSRPARRPRYNPVIHRRRTSPRWRLCRPPRSFRRPRPACRRRVGEADGRTSHRVRGGVGSSDPMAPTVLSRADAAGKVAKWTAPRTWPGERRRTSLTRATTAAAGGEAGTTTQQLPHRSHVRFGRRPRAEMNAARLSVTSRSWIGVVLVLARRGEVGPG